MVDCARSGAALALSVVDYGEDTPERVAKRLPLPQRRALSALAAADGALDCQRAGITQSVLRGLRAKNLARSPDERQWFILPLGRTVLRLLPPDG